MIPWGDSSEVEIKHQAHREKSVPTGCACSFTTRVPRRPMNPGGEINEIEHKTHEINEIKHEINGIQHVIEHKTHEINEIKHEINEIKHKDEINEIKHKHKTHGKQKPTMSARCSRRTAFVQRQVKEDSKEGGPLI